MLSKTDRYPCAGFLRSWKSPGILFVLENSWNFVSPEKSPGILFVMEKVLDSKDDARNALCTTLYHLIVFVLINVKISGTRQIEAKQ